MFLNQALFSKKIYFTILYLEVFLFHLNQRLPLKHKKTASTTQHALAYQEHF